MYCENCGTKNQNDSAFCEQCGTRMRGNNATTPEQHTALPPQNNNKNKIIIVIATVAIILAITLSLCIGMLLGKSDNNKGDAVVDSSPVPTLAPEEPAVVATVEPIPEPTAEPVNTPTPTKVPTQAPQQQLETPQNVPDVTIPIRPSDPSNGEPAEILQIRAWFQDTENNARESSKKDGVTCYRKNGELVKIRVDAGYVFGDFDAFLTNNKREYFYRNGQLYFAHIVTANPAGDRFYYVDDGVIRYSDPHDQNHYYNEQITPYMSLAYSCRNEGNALFGWNY